MIIVFVIESYIDGRNVTPRGFFWMVTPRPYENEHNQKHGRKMIMDKDRLEPRSFITGIFLDYAMLSAFFVDRFWVGKNINPERKRTYLP